MRGEDRSGPPDGPLLNAGPLNNGPPPPGSPVNAPLVQRLLVAACIHQVLLIGPGEIAVAAQVLAGTEVEVITLRGMQDGIDEARLRQIDRPGRQAGVHIGVVGRIHPHVRVQHAVQRIQAQRELQRGVCLQGHADAQPVEVYAGDHRRVRRLARFCLHDARQGAHFTLRKAQRPCRRLPVRGPKALVLGGKPVDQFIRLHGPPHLVRVGEEQGNDRFPPEAQPPRGFGREHGLQHGQ